MIRMGQHKHNPNVILAKEGKLPPKKPKLSKRQTEMLLKQMVIGKMCEMQANAIKRRIEADENGDE